MSSKAIVQGEHLQSDSRGARFIHVLRLGLFPACLALLMFLQFTATTAHAEDAKGQVIIILAKEGVGKVDPSLKAIKALQRPPFNSFRSMKVLSKPSVSLSLKIPSEVKLPNGRSLRLTLEQKQPDGKYLVGASLKSPTKKKYTMLLRVVATPGDPFFVAGQKYEEGTLIVGVTLKK